MKIDFNKLMFEDYVKEQRKYWLDRKTFFKFFRKGKSPLNFDADNRKQAKEIEENLKKTFKKKNYTILKRTSPTKRGYHFTVLKDGKQLFLSSKRVLKIREKMGDCYGRQKWDKMKLKIALPISILFDYKTRPKEEMKLAGAWKPIS